MRYYDSKTFQYAAILSGIALFLALTGPAYCQDDNIALMLQLSPIEGGKVNIEQGVHMYERDSAVTLKAAANPGYQFVYWIGDVTEPAISTTIVHLGGPKIIIAVFERSKFEILEAEQPPQLSVSGGGLYRSRVERGSDASGDIVYRPPSFHLPGIPHKPPVPEGSDLPVTDDNKIPEPATCLYFLFSIFYLRTKTGTGSFSNRKLKIEN